MQTDICSTQPDTNSPTLLYTPFFLTSPSNSYEGKFVQKCAGCHQVILDRSYLFVEDSYWHMGCLKCCACAQPLDNSRTCFVKDTRVYCRNDYKRLFGSQLCTHCGVFIEPHELVMRVHDRVYHANYKCFSCCSCQRPFTTGQEFVEVAPNLICMDCCDRESSSEYFDINLHKPGRPKKRKAIMTSSHLDSMGGMAVNYVTEEIRSDTERMNFPPHKSKRMRTSFKHHQLRAMKAYFHQNHNPDAKDLKQLAQETGLTKRVLQVWFQNARAKYRRGRAQDKTTNPSFTKGSDVTKSENDVTTQQDSNCSDSITSSIGTSPGSDAYLYDVTSSCDDVTDSRSPNFPTTQTPAAQVSPIYPHPPYSDGQYIGSMTSLSTISTTSALSSTLESVQEAMTSPCSL
ncbi:LIM/homeobox protein Lhx9 [Ciona intestinalis]